MAKRYIEDSITHNPKIKALSDGAFRLWVQMIVCADDFGILPANLDRLADILRLSETQQTHLSANFAEVRGSSRKGSGLGIVFKFRDEDFFAHDQETWERIQGRDLHKRTQSKFLHLSTEDVQSILNITFRELRGSSRKFAEVPRLARARAGASSSSSLKESLSKKRRSTKKEKTSQLKSDESNPIPPVEPKVDKSHPIPSELNQETRAADIPAEVVRIMHRIGHRLNLDPYKNISALSWTPDLNKIGREIGFACLLHEAEKFEQWLVGAVEARRVSPGVKPNPRSRFLNSWLRGQYGPKPEQFTTGDTAASFPARCSPEDDPYSMENLGALPPNGFKFRGNTLVPE